MERGFDVRSGSVAIGDPTMGLITFDLHLPSGRYICDRGALREPLNNDAQLISLDGPYVFVVDAALKERFLECYHRAFDECRFVIPAVVKRLNEVDEKLGAEVGFYWEGTLSGKWVEGTYSLDATKITRI